MAEPRLPQFPRPIRSIRFVLALCALTLAACGSDPAPTAVESVDPADAPVPTTVLLNDDEVQPGTPRQTVPQVEQPNSVEVTAADPSGATPWGAGVVLSSEFDGISLLNEWTERHWFVDQQETEELYSITSVDGDGSGGLIFTTTSTLWSETADGVLTTLYDFDSGNAARVADVGESSLGTVALVLWDDFGMQHLSGVALDNPGEFAFDTIVNNDVWQTHHAALIGDERDQILLTGSANGCLSLSAINFDGTSAPVQYVPLSSPVAVDSLVQPEVCSEAESIAASWGPDNIVVIAEAGAPARITAYNTETGERVWLAPSSGGPYDPRVSIDIDVMDGSTVAVVAGGWTGESGYLIDVASLFTDAPQIELTNSVGTAGEPESIRLAPGFGPESVRADTSIVNDVPDEITEPSPPQGEGE